MVEITLICEKKKMSGTSKSRFLRKQGLLPAILYGANLNQMVALKYKDFIKQQGKKNLLFKLVKLKLYNKIFRAVLKEIQFDPVSDRPIHLDFQSVQEEKPIRIYAMIKITNANKSPGLKKGGILNMTKKYINCVCDPQNIPDCIEIDISGLDIGKNMSIRDVKLPQNVTLLDKKNFTILTIAGREDDKETKEELAVEEMKKNKTNKE